MGKIKNRETFLNHLADQLGRTRRKTVERPNWKSQPQWSVLADRSQDELVHILEEQCQAIHTDFVRTDLDNLQQVLLDVFQKYNGKSIIIDEDERFSSFGLSPFFSELDGIQVKTWNSDKREESVRFAEQSDIGITFSEITLAESGTVVLFSGKGKGRSVSLLPENYIAIIPKSTLVPRMSQATREIHKRIENGEKVASSVNFISGPSNSADIEMNLVVGVHGPIRATYIVVEDK